MRKGLRACPICPRCGSRKFKVVEKDEKETLVECLSCARRLQI